MLRCLTKFEMYLCALRVTFRPAVKRIKVPVAVRIEEFTPSEAKYALIIDGKFTTADAVAIIIRSSAATVKRVIIRLKEKDLTEMMGSTKSGSWKSING